MSLSAYGKVLLVTMLLLVVGALRATSDALPILTLVGDDEDLTCIPSPSSWTLDGSPLENVPGLTYEEISSYSVRLNNVSDSAQGIYKCLDSGGGTIETFNLTVVGRPSFAGCETTSTTDSGCDLLPITTVTSMNISFNASIAYASATAKPFIGELEIRDSEGVLLVRCKHGIPCTFKNAFEGRALRSDGGDPTVMDTILIVVQNASLNDTGSYSLTIEYYESSTSTLVQRYKGDVDVNVTLANAELTSSASASSSDIMPSSLVTVASSSVPITPSPVFTTTTSQPKPTTPSLQPGETSTEMSVPTESKTMDDWEIHIFYGAIVGTFIFTVIVCLIIVTTVMVSRQRFKGKKTSDSESTSSSELPSSSISTTEEESSDPLQDSSPNGSTEQSSESMTSKAQTTEVSSLSRHISISESFQSFPFVDSTPPEPPEGYPKLSEDKNSPKICV